MDDALVDLDLEQSEPNWDGMDMDFMDIDAMSMAAVSQDHSTPPSDPPQATQPAQAPQDEVIPLTLLPVFQEQGDLAERVHIPDAPTDVDETPHPSPRLPAAVPASPSPAAPTIQDAPSQPSSSVPAKPKSFKEHKLALQKLEDDHDMEAEGSDDSDADEDYGLAIEEVKKYFASHPDLAALYTNPEADNVQCPACNKLLGKTVFDVYQHASTSKTKHNLMHRGVAAAIAALYGDQAPPRRQVQVPREETRPDRRPAARRSRH